MAIALHSVAKCLATDCPWEADGPASDQQANLHTTSTARGAIHHATVTRTHPTTRCAQEGCHDHTR